MKIYTKKDSIVKRNIHDVAYLINVSDNYLDEKCRLYELNQIGSVIWDLLDDDYPDQIEGIANKIKNMIIDDIPINVIINDVTSFLELMKSEGFLEEVENGRTE